MRWVGILPYAFQPYFDECVKTMHPKFKQNVLAVDDTDPKNRMGIMKVHNFGVDKMMSDEADWLVVVSAAIRFGKSGGLDFLKTLERHSDHQVIHAATPNVKGGLQQKPEGKDQKNGIFGWHLMAINRKVFEAIGNYDENFSPYGMDDLDLSLRIRKHYGDDCKWDTFPVDVSDTTMSHSINLAGVKSSFPPRNSYFKRKHGRDSGDWKSNSYDHPFNDPTKPLSYWPKPDDPLSIHQVEFKSDQWTYDE